MKKSWFVLILALLLLAVASFAATRLLSQPARTQPQQEPLFGMLHSYLGLTPDQQREIADIEGSYAAQRQELRQRLWDERDHFLAVMRDPNSSKAEALAAMRRFAQAREAMGASTLEYVFDMRGVLTPAQRDKLTSVMDRGACALTCGPGVGGCGRGGMAPGCGMPSGGGGRHGRRWGR